MALVFAHESFCGISFEDHFEAPDCFGVQFVVDEHFWFKISVDVSFGEADGVIEVDGKFLEYSWVVVLWYFSFLAKFDFIDF